MDKLRLLHFFSSFLSYIISKMIECHGARSFYLAVSHGANSIFFIFVYHESITFKAYLFNCTGPMPPLDLNLVNLNGL